MLVDANEMSLISKKKPYGWFFTLRIQSQACQLKHEQINLALEYMYNVHVYGPLVVMQCNDLHVFDKYLYMTYMYFTSTCTCTCLV